MESEVRLIDANKLMVCHINVGTAMFPRMEAFVRAEDIEAAPIVEAAPVVHGRWIAENRQTLIPVEYDNDGNPILHDYVVYRCDQCGRAEKAKEPYCHCGAKMDLKEE